MADYMAKMDPSGQSPVRGATGHRDDGQLSGQRSALPRLSPAKSSAAKAAGAKTSPAKKSRPQIAAQGEPEAYAGAPTGAPAPDETMRKWSVVIAGHRTSVSLEGAFWDGLKRIANHEKVSVNRLVEAIDLVRATNLSSAIRVHVLRWYAGRPD